MIEFLYYPCHLTRHVIVAAFQELLEAFLDKNAKREMFNYKYLSYDVASGSEITPCNKICKPLVVYRFTGNVMTSITTLRT